MTFHCRDLSGKIFEFEAGSAKEAASYLEKYEEEHNTCVQCYEKQSRFRICGGILWPVRVPDWPVQRKNQMKLK